jgi:hypothetical protein
VIAVPVSFVIILFSLTLALSEDFLRIYGATLQLWWAKFLQGAGLFDLWKKKRGSLKVAVDYRKERLRELYGREDNVSESV